MNANNNNQFSARIARAGGGFIGKVERRFFVSESTPEPRPIPTLAGPNQGLMLCLFLDRFEPFAVPRKSKLIWIFGIN